MKCWEETGRDVFSIRPHMRCMQLACREWSLLLVGPCARVE